MKFKKTLLSFGTIGVVLAPAISVVACSEETLYDVQGNVVTDENAVEGLNSAEIEEVKKVGDGSGLTYTEVSDGTKYYIDVFDNIYLILPADAVESLDDPTKLYSSLTGILYEEMDSSVDPFYYDDQNNYYVELPNDAELDVVNTAEVQAEAAVGDGSGNTYYTEDPTAISS